MGYVNSRRVANFIVLYAQHLEQAGYVVDIQYTFVGGLYISEAGKNTV